jgi:hypothetical protein
MINQNLASESNPGKKPNLRIVFLMLSGCFLLIPLMGGSDVIWALIVDT